MRIRTHNFLEVTAEDSVVDLDGARSALCLSHTSSTSCLYRRDLKKRKMIRFSGEGNCERKEYEGSRFIWVGKFAGLWGKFVGYKHTE